MLRVLPQGLLLHKRRVLRERAVSRGVWRYRLPERSSSAKHQDGYPACAANFDSDLDPF